MGDKHSDKIGQLRAMIAESKRMVFFGGAGVSTESGIPDFRSTGGLYHQEWAYPPETILSHTFFMANTEEFYRFYRAKLIVENIQPNAAHKALAKWEADGKLTGVVTQNIDGLHQVAGSKTVYELHGSIHRNFCMECRAPYPLSFIAETTGVPRCPKCGGLVKPDVVLYEEALDNGTVEGAVNAINWADLLIIGGTSLTVYPAAGLVQGFRGKNLVVINRDATQADSSASLVIADSIGEVFSAVRA
jgi:NAD-dependent deacetylase